MLLGVGFVKIAANVFFCREFTPEDSIICDTGQEDPEFAVQFAGSYFGVCSGIRSGILQGCRFALSLN